MAKFNIEITRTSIMTKTISVEIKRADVVEHFDLENANEWRDHVKDWMEDNWDVEGMIAESNDEEFELESFDEEWEVEGGE